MAEEKRNIKEKELKYSNSMGRSGEIFSETFGGKKKYFMTIEIETEKAEYFLRNPEKFIAIVDGKDKEWEAEKKTL